jgi:hypothetical protein
VLDLRVYRLAFVPALVLVFVAAFALENRPAPARSFVAADAFNTDRAYGTGSRPARNSLRELARAVPQRRPGSAGDVALANRVQAELRALGLQVTRRRAAADVAGEAAELEIVEGVRPGPSSRRLVVLAHRDALEAPAAAALSGTATLLEIARIAEVRDLAKTLVVVSTSGGSAGAAGARTWARSLERPELVDAVLVLGDLASDRPRKPWVVPWSNDARPASHALRRTVEQALRAEVGEEPGAARAPGQWVRRALPLTLSEQGELLAGGLPAVLVSATGELAPAGDAPVSRERLEEFGRATLRALTALDETGGEPPFAQATDGIVTVRKVLPTWTVRLLVLSLLAPALVAALDGAFRARRRGLAILPWVRWAAAGAIPLLGAWSWARALDITGAFDVPQAPVPPGAIPFELAGILALASTVAVAGGLWWALKPFRRRLVRGHGNPAGGVGAVAVGGLVSTVALATWVINPYAAVLLVPAAHLWLFAATPGSWLSRSGGLALAVLGGLALPALGAVYYLRALGLDVLDLGWLTFLASAGGALGLGGAVVGALMAACLIALLEVLRGRRWIVHEAARPPAPPRTRGPAGYAGPGSLGGTESALRR